MAGSSAPNPLAVYRQSASFSVDAMRNLLYGEDCNRFKHCIWRTLASDPLFRSPATELTLDEKRKLTFQRVKRLVEYNFATPEDLLENPARDQVFTMALCAYDPALLTSYRLHFLVSSRCAYVCVLHELSGECVYICRSHTIHMHTYRDNVFVLQARPLLLQ